MPFFPFEIHQPSSVTEASEMLREFGEEGTLYAGGTELLLAMKFDALRFRHLVDVKTVPGLSGLEVRDGVLKIGAATTHYALEKSEIVRRYLPVLAKMEAAVANVRVRTTGTIGGNLCFAEPHSDPMTLLSVLNASIEVESHRGRREVPVQEFISGPFETSLQPEELLTGVRIPLLRPNQRACYLKFQPRERPTLGLALVVEMGDDGESITGARVAIGCVSSHPRRSSDAEKLMMGRQSVVAGQLDRASEVLADEAELLDDLDGGVDYKRNLIRVFLRRAYLSIIS